MPLFSKLQKRKIENTTETLRDYYNSVSWH